MRRRFRHLRFIGEGSSTLEAGSTYCGQFTALEGKKFAGIGRSINPQNRNLL